LKIQARLNIINAWIPFGNAWISRTYFLGLKGSLDNDKDTRMFDNERMLHRKGSTLETLQPWKVIPLFAENESKRQKWTLLPGYSRYNQRETGSIEQQPCTDDDTATCQYTRDLLRSTTLGDVIFPSIIGAMALLQQEESDVLMGIECNEMEVPFDDSPISSRALRQSWKTVHTRITFDH
jgi:hypothetical protein